MLSQLRTDAYVSFGNYPQEHGDTPEPIEWIVLEKDKNTALLLTKHGLDCKRFHHVKAKIRWDKCDLRKWLNGEFLHKAFSDKELAQIAETAIQTDDNPNGTKGCCETIDKVFCLSIEEVWKYFASSDERKCSPTSYAVSHNARKCENGCCWFWLRSRMCE